MKTEAYFAPDFVKQAAPTCQNCGASVVSQYCPDCGQKHPQKRLTLKEVFHLAYESLVDFDRGLFFTAWQLLVRPHVVIRDYIAGRRVIYTNPVKYMLIWLGVSTFLSLAVIDIDKLQQQMKAQTAAESAQTAEEKAAVEKLQHDWMEFLSTNPQVMYAVLVPLLGLFSLWLFRRSGYTYAEHLTANTYLMAQSTLVLIPTYPLYLLFPNHLAQVSFWLSLLMFAYYMFGTAVLFRNDKGNYWKPALKGLTVSVLAYLMLFLVLGVAGAAYGFIYAFYLTK
jgi:uncharacterized membrane protein (DUF106 family)